MTSPVINLGPLTAVFTPAPTCFEPTAILSDTFYYAVEGLTGVPGDHNHMVPSCFPESFSSVYTEVYYSPGLCPSGFNQQSIEVSNNETSAWCCPPGLSFSTSSCVLQTSTTTTFNHYWNGTTSQVLDGPYAVSTGIISVWAPAINIRWKEADFTTTTTMTPTSSSAPSFSNLLSAGSNTTSGLSTGAKIGICVGIPLATFAIAGILAIFFLRRRSNKMKAAARGNIPPQNNSHSYDGQSTGQQNKPAELFSSPFSQPVGSYGYATQSGLYQGQPPLHQTVELHSANPAGLSSHHELGHEQKGSNKEVSAPVTLASFPQYVQKTAGGNSNFIRSSWAGPVPDFLASEPDHSAQESPRT